MNRRSFTALAVLLAACGAGREEAAAQPLDRCAHCGMRLDASWLASGATAASGAAAQFDTPKCLFAWLGGDEGRGATGAWTTDYYARARRPVEALGYVDGSDLMGPMGQDLIPIDPHDRERFVADHGGTALDLAGARARGPELFRY